MVVRDGYFWKYDGSMITHSIIEFINTLDHNKGSYYPNSASAGLFDEINSVSRDIIRWVKHTRSENEEQFNAVLVFLGAVTVIFMVLLLFAISGSFKQQTSVYSTSVTTPVLKDKKTN